MSLSRSEELLDIAKKILPCIVPRDETCRYCSSALLLIAICYEANPDTSLDNCTHRFCRRCVLGLIQKVAGSSDTFILERDGLSYLPDLLLQLYHR